MSGVGLKVEPVKESIKPVNEEKSEPILWTDNLVKRFGKKVAVAGISLSVKPGEVVGLLGPNGAGKTTTFYMITGLIKPNSGRVFLGNDDITKLPMYKRARMGITYLPQEPSIFRTLTVEQNLMAILEFVESESSKRKQKLESLLEKLEIKHLRKQPAYTLSGGEGRRVEIARSLCAKPKFFLLDEPFSGIDPIVVGELKKLITSLKNLSIGILITDHNVRDVLSIVDRAYIIYKGEVLIEGKSEFLLSDEKAKEIYLGPEFKM